MSNKQFERMVENLQGIMRCPHCSGQYELSDIHYLGQMDSMTFLHMRCGGCSSPVFASVALTNDQGEIKPADIAASQLDLSLSDIPEESPIESESAGFARKQLTDQSEEKSEPLLSSVSDSSVDVPIEDISVNRILKAALNPVTYDDVLDTHQYLESATADLEAIFGKA
jgi:hypothetical protein